MAPRLPKRLSRARTSMFHPKLMRWLNAPSLRTWKSSRRMDWLRVTRLETTPRLNPNTLECGGSVAICGGDDDAVNWGCVISRVRGACQKLDCKGGQRSPC